MLLFFIWRVLPLFISAINEGGSTKMYYIINISYSFCYSAYIVYIIYNNII